jgi:hypothetical protein
MPVAVGGAIAGDVRTLTEVILLPHGLANAVEVLRASVFSRQPH